MQLRIWSAENSTCARVLIGHKGGSYLDLCFVSCANISDYVIMKEIYFSIRFGNGSSSIGKRPVNRS